MRRRADLTEFQKTHQVRIMPPAHDALEKKMHDAVARRAFQIYESRGCTAEHDRDDWRLAETDVVRPLDCGMIVQDNRVCLTTDVSCFGPGTLELWVEPHRITLCGPCPTSKLERAAGPQSANGQKNIIFRARELSTEVSPAEVTVRFNGPAMHIYLRRALPIPQQAVLARAA